MKLQPIPLVCTFKRVITLLMTKVSLIALCLCLTISSMAQKVKYKDLYPDLEARKFNKVEPLLKQFLADKKNQNHPNAHYQMGLITEANFLLQDIVADTATLFPLGEESLSFYKKSLTLITEKELKKHDEYYQSFYRRDLRTGDFGIKLSDVHLDIEKKIESIEGRMEAVKSFHLAVEELSTIEKRLLDAFNTLVTTSKSYGDYLLYSDLEAISQLGDIQAEFKAFNDKAAHTLKVGSQLEVVDYFQKISYQPIKEFEELTAIFPESNEEIVTWDFAEWAKAAKVSLNTEIFPLKEEILTLDQRLSKATLGFKSGNSVNFPVEVPADMSTTFQKYDPESIARRLLEARIRENTIRYLADTAFNKELLDSTIIAQQVQVTDSVIWTLNDLKDLLSFDTKELSEANRYYDQYFAASFEGEKGIVRYQKKATAWADKLLVSWDTVRAFWDLRNNWGLMETDTVPLRTVDSTYTGNYATKGFLELTDNEIISWGVRKDSLSGFVAKFGADRKLQWKSAFESLLIGETASYTFMSDTLAAGEGAISFYLFDETPLTAEDLTVVHVSIDGQLAWAVNAVAHQVPQYTTFNEVIGETTIFLYPQEAYPLPSGELGYIVIDKDGEIR